MSIRRFNESYESTVVGSNKYVDMDDVYGYVRSAVKQIEKATGIKVKKISGEASDDVMSYNVILMDGSEISTDLNNGKYSGDQSIFTITYTENFAETVRKEVVVDNDIDNIIFKTLTSLLDNMYYKHYIKLPKEPKNNDPFYYDLRGSDSEYNYIWFKSEEEGRKWINNLSIKIWTEEDEKNNINPLT